MKCTKEGHVLTFTFDDGIPPVVFDADKSALGDDAKMHGFEQKLRDSAAIARKQPNGTVITVTEEMRHENVVAMATHLETSTTWNQKGTTSQNPAIVKLATMWSCTYGEALVKVANAALADIEAEK